ncbi:MAG: hypothetical protein ACYTHJ_05430 [Planctomycetota bacterium]|jgi:hypothetical protein
MNKRWRFVLVTLFAGVLFLLHNDEWLFVRNGRHVLLDAWQPLFGWLPVDMAYNMAWVMLGVVFCYLLMRWTWSDES